MEIALLAGKYVLAILIYVFVWVVYKGLVAQARADREEEAARQARAEVPRMTGPVPVPTPRRMAPAPASAPPAAIPAPAPPPVGAAPVPVAPTPPPPVQTASSAESVRAALAEDMAEEESVREQPHVPALLAKELPPEIAAAEGLAPQGPTPGAVAKSVMEALAEAEPLVAPLTPAPGPEPGTLVVSSTTPRLVVLHTESVELAPGREFPLLAAATIGRAGHNLVVLSDTFASSQHALIFLKEGRRVLRDRGSTNGTLVNGHRISGDHFLRDGDQITVGTTLLRYVEPE